MKRQQRVRAEGCARHYPSARHYHVLDGGEFSRAHPAVAPRGLGTEVVTQTLKCERHGETTRLTCVDCDRPICPKCMVRTEVGLKCEQCAEPVAAPGVGRQGSRLPLIVIGLALMALAVVAVLVLRPDPPEEDVVAALPPTGSWAGAADLTSIRGTTAAVVLDDGSVLVAGGGVGAIALDAAEVLDAAAAGEEWRPAAPLTQARRGHQGVILDDGRVLVAGGLFEGQPLASAEIYDPEADAWTPTGPMATPRLGHSLTKLRDGRVLAAGGSAIDSDETVAGGQTIRTAASAEIYDPATGAWQAAQPMGSPRFEHTATLLGDGRVLIVGGFGPTGDGDETAPLRSTEIYDPAANAFVTSTDLTEGRANHAATQLSDDAVLVTGGSGGERGDFSLASAEIFDARAGTWTTVGAMGGTRTGHTATRLDDGRVLVAGGESVQRGSRRSLTSAEVFDFDLGATGEWRSAGDMSCPRSEHSAVLLGDGSVLVAAGDAAFPGQAPMAQSCVDRYQPESSTPEPDSP